MPKLILYNTQYIDIQLFKFLIRNKKKHCVEKTNDLNILAIKAWTWE